VWGCYPHAKPPTWRTRVSLFVWIITLDLSGMGGPTNSICYCQHSSQHHVTTQAPPLRQNRDTFGGRFSQLLCVFPCAECAVVEKCNGKQCCFTVTGHMYEALRGRLPYRGREVSLPERDDKTGVTEVPRRTDCTGRETASVATHAHVDTRLSSRNKNQGGVRHVEETGCY